jgi:hypothetical protein
MSAITMTGLSASDAEEALVRVWLVLEKHEVASPEVVVISISDHLRIQLFFALREDADVVRLRLKDWVEVRGVPVH